MQSAFDVLARDHKEIMRLLGELELGPTATTGASSDELALRMEMVQQLIIEESKHEAAEEMYFWPAVRTRVPDGDALATQACGQEQEGKAILDRVDKLGPEDEEFEAQLAQFVRAGRAHIVFEETTVWPALRAALGAQEADHLGYLLDGAKKIAATRPHP
jgi:hemerythrin superfamily protein